MKNLFISSLMMFVFLMMSTVAFSQIEGKWKTIDDETGEAKSIVEIWKAKDGLYYGKIIKLFDETKQNDVCDECDKDDPRYNKPIIGMVIIRKMEKVEDNEWDEGDILDPANGKVYDCKMWREGKNLQVRGYIGWSLIGRSQTWLPAQ
ncbi:MAG: DUF2147 domain-containing protein [Bacteroidales bacterium]|nr:DUF2147 domain-containing protein [Bacteroidales bacterium]